MEYELGLLHSDRRPPRILSRALDFILFHRGLSGSCNDSLQTIFPSTPRQLVS